MARLMKRSRSRKNLFWNRFIPGTLFGRSLIIILMPLILVQIISTYVFFDRHWEAVSRQLASNLANQVSIAVALAEPRLTNLKDLKPFIEQHLNLDLEYTPNQDLPLPHEPAEFLELALTPQIKMPFITHMDDNTIDVYVSLKGGILHCVFSSKRLLIKTIPLYIAWSLGASVFFLMIAAIFMRNQIRPLRRLMEAAENFGKGRDVSDFRPAGSTEIRKAGSVFIIMRDRIRRHVNQRTQMLAGVSHDLRTPLTRMKLQLALLPPNSDYRLLEQDIKEMEVMIDGYIAFVRGEGDEQATSVVLVPFLRGIIDRFQDPCIHLKIQTPFDLKLLIKPQSLQRCLMNLIINAQRYGGDMIHVTLSQRKNVLDIWVDDNGPGIPLDKRQEVFKPFYRLETSRNSETGGSGLGLTIARDSARSHGGNLILNTSPLGGLRAQLHLPL